MSFHLSAISRLLGDAEPDSLRSEATVGAALGAASELATRFPAPDHTVRIFTPASELQDLRLALLGELARLGITAEVI